MDKKTIKENIITYLMYNKTKECDSIPFTNIFGEYANSEKNCIEVRKIIQDSIHNVVIDEFIYHIGTWNCDNGLFYIKTLKRIMGNNCKE